MAMANTAERMDALRDVEFLLRGIDLDGFGWLQIRIFNLHGGRTFRVCGLRHDGYDGRSLRMDLNRSNGSMRCLI